MIPVNEPIITDDAKRRVTEAIEGGWISSAGPQVKEFEQAFASYIGTAHGVAVSSGTAALHVALRALDVGPGDEVVLPDFTMGACLMAVRYTGATPVFVDVDRETFTMDPALLEACMTPKTKAVMPVHIYGHPCDMDPIFDVAKEHGFAIVEDAAEAHGARYKGRLCGSMGAVGVFSFYANKIISTGEGGMVVTDDAALAERMRSLRDLAHSKEKRFFHKEVAFNYRLTALQAALGIGQLEHIDRFVEKKRRMASAYAERLSGLHGLRLPVTKPWAENVHWMYAVLVEEGLGVSRDELRRRLLDRGVDTRDFFVPLHLQPIAEGFAGDQQFPVTDDIAERGFYLPSGLALTEEQLGTVCDVVKEVVSVNR